MNEDLDQQDEITTEVLLQDLKNICENGCARCEGKICGHEALMSLIMGFKTAPRCWPCLAEGLGYGKEALRDRMASLIASRACYNEGWLWANQQEGIGPGGRPSCLWPADQIGEESSPSTVESGDENETPFSKIDADYDAEWDAGDMACGDLVFELRIQIQTLRQGQIFKVRATDPGAKKDLPSWCRITGNNLLAVDHPIYLIRKK